MDFVPRSIQSGVPGAALRICWENEELYGLRIPELCEKAYKNKARVGMAKSQMAGYRRECQVPQHLVESINDLAFMGGNAACSEQGHGSAER